MKEIYDNYPCGMDFYNVFQMRQYLKTRNVYGIFLHNLIKKTKTLR